MRVLYFGSYERDYPRNAQVISCLRTAGVDVFESHVSVWETKRHKLSVGVREVAKLALAEIRLARRSANDAEVIVVGYPGHLDMRAARRIAGGRPIVFNPLVSLEDTMVADRSIVSAASWRARLLRSIDRYAFRTADLVVADTAAHAEYFREEFSLPEERMAVCVVGAEDRLFQPGPSEPRASFTALFVGKLIPLHGIETILAAAALCGDIPFRVVGSGQLDAVMATRPPNVRWDRWVDYERLAQLYHQCGCALGIFGRSDKAARVIPNKAFQAIATATALVTADSPAARELFTDGYDALLVPPGDPEALAAAIRRLSSDPLLRIRLAEQGRATYVENASEEVLGRRWRGLLEAARERRTLAD